MKALYSIAQVSKQAHHQYLSRLDAKVDRTALYLQLVDQAREMHPNIGLAKVYHLFYPTSIGRDAFVNLATMAGYALEKALPISWKGDGGLPYQNLLSGKAIREINQVWATDITYYLIGGEYYYISMIMDLYSRRILASCAAPSLHAIHSLKVLKQALKGRELAPDHGLIHHSDRGVQYTSITYTQLLKKKGIAISMCNSVYENTIMERLNGIIKNDYLIHWAPKSFAQLKRLLKKAVNNYNNCPHGSLGMLSPIQFEEKLKQIPLIQREILRIYTSKRAKFTDPNQLVLFDKNHFIV